MKVSIIVLGFAARCLAALPVIQDYSNPSLNASQLRIAYNGPNGMSVAWNTPNKLLRPIVWYGQHVNFPFEFAIGTSTTFNSSTNWDNIVYIDNLLPNTKYYYRVTDQPAYEGDFNQPENFYFVTAKEAGDHSSFSVAAFGDLGIITGTTPETAQIPDTFYSVFQHRSDFDFIWHSGDFGYANDWSEEEADGIFPNITGSVAYTDIMNSYYDQFVNVTMNTPYMVGPGNHEAECGVATANPVNCVAGQQNFTSYRHHFAMPTKDQTVGYVQNMWYSWNYGMAHFVQFNTETDFPSAPEHVYSGPFGTSGQQIAWLEADLAAVDRTVTPWVIVSGHRPWYSASTNCTACGDAFESVMVKYNVDVVWAGHVHFYERDTPIANGVPDPKGLNNPTSPWYITSGAAGNVEGHGKPKSPLPTFVEYVNSTSFGWSKWTFHNSSSLTHQFISSETNEVMDEATLYKDHGLKW
ncbi:Metallo-dependent phosphatase-like protein [Lipomyces orientalis]|uniref:Metallo-dependent phosphatase-like protein n=1 Tax=Lipomyces orientalis TaxID=1233043 RepID=A0ACC3TFN0_9ASCO